MQKTILQILTLFVICAAIFTLPVFGQNQPSNQPQQVTEEMQKALLKQQVLDQIAVDRTKFVEGLVGRWASVTTDGGVELRNTLMSVSDDKIADASSADTMDALNESIFGSDDLGSASTDLVYNKVTPCRIIDTRLAGGPLVAGATRNFDGSAVNFSGQGGSNTSCGLPPLDTAALVVILVAVNAQGVGNLRAWPKDSAPPTAVMINYNSSNNLANSVIIPLKQDINDLLEFSLSANVSNTHVVADVIGYFFAPSATPLACVTITAFDDVPHLNSWSFSTSACPVKTSLTGGGVEWSASCITNVWFWDNRPNDTNTGWLTRGYNNCGVSVEIKAYARCCKIPGF